MYMYVHENLYIETSYLRNESMCSKCSLTSEIEVNEHLTFNKTIYLKQDHSVY